MDETSWIKAIFGGAGSTLVGILATYFVTRKQRSAEREKAEERSVSFKYFSPSDGNEFNEPFYKYFIEKINLAKRQIYVSGEGFGDHSARIAGNYNDAIKTALRNNVRVVRVQTSRDTSEVWTSMLEGLVREFPASFELFVLREPTQAQMTSICIIDPELKETCVVEMMITSRAMFGSRPANLAGAAVFIERDTRLAVDLRDGLLTMRLDKSAFRVSSPQAVREC